jgi:hypothetical protein
MPVIRISDQTLNRLRAYATPLEHSANDIVAMALDALDSITTRTRRAKLASTQASRPNKKRVKLQRTGLSQKELRMVLLETLYAMGGDATTREVRNSLERILAPVLTEIDREVLSNGNARWWNVIGNLRNDLCAERLLRDDSRWGIWELSKHGRLLLDSRGDHIGSLKQPKRKAVKLFRSAAVRRRGGKPAQ